MDTIGHYEPLLRADDAIIRDGNRLQELGYKQELSRSLSVIGNFAVTFSIISVLTGLTTMFNMGLEYGGPATMIYGWPIVGLMTLMIGFSMAEICSAYPTSGGLYFWSAKLCGNRWGPLASWLTGWYVQIITPYFSSSYIATIFDRISCCGAVVLYATEFVQSPFKTTLLDLTFDTM